MTQDNEVTALKEEFNITLSFGTMLKQVLSYGRSFGFVNQIFLLPSGESSWKKMDVALGFWFP